MATPFNIRDWIKLIATQVSNALGAPLPVEPIIAFNPPLVAVDDPTNSRTQVYSQGSGVVTATATSGTTSLSGALGSLIVPFDTSAGNVTILFPTDAPVGFEIMAVDVGLATTSFAHVVYSGTAGDKVQSPETMNLSTSLTITQVRNVSFVRIASTGQGNFWAAS